MGWVFSLFNTKTSSSDALLMETCVAEQLTPRTPDLEVRGSSLAPRVVSLDKELYSTLSLFTQVYIYGYVRHTAEG